MVGKHKFSFFLGLVAVIGVLALGAVFKPLSKDVYFFGEVSEVSISKVLEQIGSTRFFETPNLVIHSPGGDATILQVAVTKIKQNSINTEVVKDAASAAAAMFMLGKNRVMHERAVIMFHEPRIRVPSLFGKPITITMTDVEAFLMTGTVAENSKLRKDSRVGEAVEFLSSLPRDFLIKMVEETQADMEKLARLVDAAAGEGVSKEVFKPNEDIELTADEALALGIATKVISDDESEGPESSDKARPRNPAERD